MKNGNSLLVLATLLITGLAAPKIHAAAGDLYQARPDNDSILKYTPGNGTPTVFTSGISGLASRIAFNKAGDLFVGDAEGIVKITPAGVKTRFATGVKVHGIRCDAAGNVFVSDGTSRSILKITPAGVKSTFAPAVDTLDLVFDPNGELVAVDHGADPSNPNGPGINGQGKIYRFKPDGTKTVTKAPLDRPTCMAIDGKGRTYTASSDGSIYVTSMGCNAEFCVGSTGSIYAGGLGNIESMACDSAGNLFVSTPSGIIKFNYKGGSGSKSTFSSIGTFAGIAFEPARSLALNISTRLRVQTGDNALIGGFIVSGNAGKKVLLRAIGPSLINAGVPGALEDPVLELYGDGVFVNGNDNWKSRQAEVEATGIPPADDRESALPITVGPGNWTVVVRGKNDTTGVALVEAYDLDSAAASSLANISTRGFVGQGDDVMIGGFILGGGNGSARIMIRAIGPSLAGAGISNPLPNPTVTLYDGNGALLNYNDDWDDENATEIYLTGIPPSNSAESAVIMILPPGNYTAVVAGLDGGTGIGLVEVYNLQ